MKRHSTTTRVARGIGVTEERNAAAGDEAISGFARWADMTQHDGRWPADDDVDVAVEAVETAYRGFLTVDHYRLRVPRFDGTMATIKRELLERGTCVCILPYDPRTDRLLLIRQFLIGSYAAGRAPRPLQVVAGMVDEGESDEAAARREAIEEAACEVRRVIRAQAFLPTPGGSSERVVAFCGEADLTDAGGVHGAADEDEDIRVEVFDAAAAIALLDEGRIESAPAVIVLSWFARHRQRVRREWAEVPA